MQVLEKKKTDVLTESVELLTAPSIHAKRKILLSFNITLVVILSLHFIFQVFEFGKLPDPSRDYFLFPAVWLFNFCSGIYNFRVLKNSITGSNFLDNFTRYISVAAILILSLVTVHINVNTATSLLFDVSISLTCIFLVGVIISRNAAIIWFFIALFSLVVALINRGVDFEYHLMTKNEVIQYKKALEVNDAQALLHKQETITERISPVHIRVFVLIWIIIFIFTLLIVIFEVGMIQKILKTIPFVVNNIHTAAEEHNRLTLENNRMSAELDVARRIQKMVLPQNSEWEGYKNLSFAARMLPATEIGGDYYDILIQPDGSVYFAIGDVTDHGLQSSVVMLMAQTAFRSVIEDKDIDLSEVIIRMNSILYSNIHDRMKDFRNLTLSLLHYKDGTLSICGQHESIIIIRKGKSEPEIIETLDLGMYVGLMPNIQEYTAILKTYLEIGDKVILYTDGIVEAENNKKELYGMDNFLQSVKSNYFEHPKELLSCILHDLEGFTENKSLLDDVSVLIFQRMK